MMDWPIEDHTGSDDFQNFEPYEVQLASELLQSVTGFDPTSPHGRETPRRFVQMLRDLTTPQEIKFTTFPNTEGLDEMVTMSDIQFYALCNHHLAPFFGVAHVAYIPEAKIVGLSKLARAVRELAKGLKVQEQLTQDIADYLEASLQPKGVAVVMEARHLCMEMRGVQMVGATTTTSAMRGVFSDHSRTAKAEFIQLIRGAK
jgi:GTP cyclohydrolase I